MEILNVNKERPYPPRVTEFTSPFWESLGEGLLQTTQCQRCHKLSFPPKHICPHCWMDSPGWTSIKHTGTLYSWTTIHASPAQFSNDLPYTVGIVDLDDNLRVACRVLTKDGIAPTVDARVRLVVVMYQDGPLLAAALAG